MIQGIVWALVIGLIGGLFPALRRRVLRSWRHSERCSYLSAADGIRAHTVTGGKNFHTQSILFPSLAHKNIGIIIFLIALEIGLELIQQVP